MRESRRELAENVSLVTPHPFAVIDRAGRVEVLSEPAAEVIAGSRTLAIVDGSLVSFDEEEQAALARLTRCESECMVASAADPVPLFLTAQSLGESVLIVFVRMDAPHTRLGRALQTAFGLTARESCIATALLEGLSLSEVAGRMSVELSTARTHLKSVFAKTRTGRQTQLIRLLSTLSFALRTSEEIFRFLPRMGDARFRKHG